MNDMGDTRQIASVGLVIAAISVALSSYEFLRQREEHIERREVFTQARQAADHSGKPLLVVGGPVSANMSWARIFGYQCHPCGDVTIDLDPRALEGCSGSKVADIRDIPYPDKYFGAAFSSHVLEHLATIDDAEQAISELDRVSDQVFIVVPSKASITAQLHPEHHLWVTKVDNGYLVEQRYRPAYPALINNLSM